VQGSHSTPLWATHVLAHSDMLGLFHPLLHVETLLLSSINRDDGKLVELNAVHKRHPNVHVESLVGLFVDTDPCVAHVHFLDNLVPLNLPFSDKETAELLVNYRGLSSCRFLGIL
jgi:hypothetical protein